MQKMHHGGLHHRTYRVTGVLSQVLQRAAAAAGAVRDGHVVHPVRGLRGAARVAGPAPLLRGALGPRGVAAARAHVLQPPRPAALPQRRAAAREAAAGRRGDQHLRHRVNLRTLRVSPHYGNLYYTYASIWDTDSNRYTAFILCVISR